MNNKTYQKNLYRKKKEEYVLLLGGMCVKCKSTKELEFDHIDRKNKNFAISRKMKESGILQELDKCQLLCKQCHREKTTSERSVPHGGGITGKKNCFCNLCAPLKRVYFRKLMRKRRSN